MDNGSIGVLYNLWLNYFYKTMSGEQLSSKQVNSVSIAHKVGKGPGKKVNINHLLLKIREERIKDRKENYIFLGVICGMVVATGIIASL